MAGDAIGDLLKEDGDELLLETGDFLNLEQSAIYRLRRGRRRASGVPMARKPQELAPPDHHPLTVRRYVDRN